MKHKSKGKTFFTPQCKGKTFFAPQCKGKTFFTPTLAVFHHHNVGVLTDGFYHYPYTEPPCQRIGYY